MLREPDTDIKENSSLGFIFVDFVGSNKKKIKKQKNGQSQPLPIFTLFLPGHYVDHFSKNQSKQTG